VCGHKKKLDVNILRNLCSLSLSLRFLLQLLLPSGEYMAATMDQMTPSVLRLVVLGGGNVLHRLLCGYVSTQHLHALDGELDDVDIVAYIVPTIRSDLATYLGVHDLWYRRYVRLLAGCLFFSVSFPLPNPYFFYFS